MHLIMFAFGINFAKTLEVFVGLATWRWSNCKYLSKRNIRPRLRIRFYIYAYYFSINIIAPIVFIELKCDQDLRMVLSVDGVLCYSKFEVRKKSERAMFSHFGTIGVFLNSHLLLFSCRSGQVAKTDSFMGQSPFVLDL